MLKSDLIVTKAGLTFFDAPVYGVHWDDDNVWEWHKDRGPLRSPDAAWFRTEDGVSFSNDFAGLNEGHIELDLPDDEDESPETLTQEELAALTDEWEASGTNLPFGIWLGGRTRRN